MKSCVRHFLAAAAVLLATGCLAAQEEKDNIAGPYVPTPWPIVDELLNLADIGPADVVYDLGSGDGRLVITAAKRFGARGVGIELQRPLIERASAQALLEGVADRVKFIQADLFESHFEEASVVTLYLLPSFVTRLVPRLRSELRPGSRIVSHDYPLAPWAPDKTLSFEVDEKEPITGSKRTVLYYYVVPAPVSGVWEMTLPATIAGRPTMLEFRQDVDLLEGVAQLGAARMPVRDPVVRGESIRFGLLARGRLLAFTGRVSGDAMDGDVSASGSGVRAHWSARRIPPAR